jgi:hypothetical protein
VKKQLKFENGEEARSTKRGRTLVDGAANDRVWEGRENCGDSSGGGRGGVPLKIGDKNTQSRRRRQMRRRLEENSCGGGKGGVPLK